ncbi:MAG: hypothetical protein HY286_06350 [Planctomycetes bacterium]|nr:hypothetical protein [Planctomycetota bacterium]
MKQVAVILTTLGVLTAVGLTIYVTAYAGPSAHRENNRNSKPSTNSNVSKRLKDSEVSSVAQSNLTASDTNPASRSVVIGASSANEIKPADESLDDLYKVIRSRDIDAMLKNRFVNPNGAELSDLARSQLLQLLETKVNACEQAYTAYLGQLDREVAAAIKDGRCETWDRPSGAVPDPPLPPGTSPDAIVSTKYVRTDAGATAYRVAIDPTTNPVVAPFKNNYDTAKSDTCKSVVSWISLNANHPNK